MSIPTDYPHEIGGLPCPLELPKSAAVRGDILACLGDVGDPQIQRRILAACLVLCSPDLQRRGAPAYGGRLLEYGGRVIDWLVTARRATAAEISTAGNAALQLVCDDFLREVKATKAASGNSEAPTGASSESSSRSSTTGAVIPIGSGLSTRSGEAG